MAQRWLNLKEAAKYSSIGQKRLILLAEDGSIRGFQDSDTKNRKWIFDRESLDSYRLSQSSATPTANDIVSSVMRRVAL